MKGPEDHQGKSLKTGFSQGGLNQTVWKYFETELELKRGKVPSSEQNLPEFRQLGYDEIKDKQNQLWEDYNNPKLQLRLMSHAKKHYKVIFIRNLKIPAHCGRKIHKLKKRVVRDRTD